MRMRIVSAAASLMLCLSATVPAMAADKDATLVDDLLQLPLQTTALGAGLIVGIPVSIATSIPKSINEAAHIIAPNRDHGTLSAIAVAIPAVPIGTISGVAQGIATGFNNAVDNCRENPFSAESMSLNSQ